MVVAVVSVASLTFGVAGAQASTPAKTTQPVKVKLFEFKVKPKPKRVAAGKVTFVVKNIGSEQHEMVIARADDAASLPTKADGGVDESQIDEANLPGEIPEFAKGKTKTKTFTLEAGTYILFCNITDKETGGPLNHFAEGMYTTFVVE